MKYNNNIILNHKISIFNMIFRNIVKTQNYIFIYVYRMISYEKIKKIEKNFKK